MSEESTDLQFRSRTGEDVSIRLLSGHTIIIGREWRPVPPIFHNDAYANQCISKDMVEGPQTGGEQSKGMTEEQRKDAIVNAITELVNAGDVSKFTSNGVPKTDVLSSMVAFQVSAAERDLIFEELKG